MSTRDPRPVGLIRRARLVPVGAAPVPGEPVDVRIAGGRVSAVAAQLPAAPGERVLDADGRWLMPGLWDAHTHPVMWGLARRRIDLAGTISPQEVCRRVAAALADAPGDGLVLGYGYRSAALDAAPSVADLDAVTGSRPVALASGDGHNGWLNTAAQRLIGLSGITGTLDEDAWFSAYRRIQEQAAATEDPEAALRTALDAAAAIGVVGIADFEFDSAWRAWQRRLAEGYRPPVRVRAATYLDGLDDVIAAGLATGDALDPGCPLVTMGSLKVISDGSLGTLTAWCCEPYAVSARAGSTTAAPEKNWGAPNLYTEALVSAMVHAAAAGLTSAIHAIGDRALGTAIEAFERSGAAGSIEHAQLLAWRDLPRLAAIGATASVQPAHLLDDRDMTEEFWPDRTDRVFPLRALHDAGVPLALGSDAPVAPLDPWLAMAAAVHRSADERPPWHPEQALTVAEALAASTDGAGTVAVGSRADLALLESNPVQGTVDGGHTDTGAQAARLREMVVSATLVDGTLVHGG